MQNPGVHDVADRLIRRLFECVPQVGRDGVAVGVLLQVTADSVAVDIGPEVELQHAQHRTTLFVGEEVEHALGVFGGDDFEFNWSRGVEAIHLEGHVTEGAKADPDFPFGTEGVEAGVSHEGGEGLVEPDALPPFHGDEVTKPHVGDFVGDDFGDALHFLLRGSSGVN